MPFLAALLLAAVVPVAPLPPTFGDLPYDDVAPRAASDGATTLVVWDNNGQFPEYGTNTANATFARNDGTPIGTAITVASPGSAPRVATNGSEYLVAYGIPISRFAQFPAPSAGVRTVQRDGTLGAQQVIDQSLHAAVITGVLWAGDRWIVAFFDETPHIAFLGGDLQPLSSTVNLTGGVVALTNIGTRVFAFQTSGGSLRAFEISGGSLTEAADATHDDAFVAAATTGNRAIVIARSAFEQLEVFTFTPGVGWSAPRTITAGTPYDLVPSGDNVLLLSGPGRGEAGPLIGTTLDPSGAVVDRQTVLPSTAGATALRFLLFTSVETSRTNGQAILSLDMPRPEPLVAANGVLVSLGRTDAQANPLIVSAGSYAMAFWNQSVDEAGNLRTFSRKFDASGQPLGDATQLPFAMGTKAHAAFDGSRFILTWDGGKLVAVSADGKTGGDVIGIFPPAEIPIAATSGLRFGVWAYNTQIAGSPLLESGQPVLPVPTPLLQTGRSQTDADLGVLGGDFVAVWREGSDIRAMRLSAAGTPSDVRTIGTAATHPYVAGDAQSALAVWLSSSGAPALVAITPAAATSNPVDPQWAEGFTAIRVASSGVPGQYFVALQKGKDLYAGAVGLQGAAVTSVGPLRRIASIGGNFALAGVGGHAVTAFESDGRVWIGTQGPSKQRIVHH